MDKRTDVQQQQQQQQRKTDNDRSWVTMQITNYGLIYPIRCRLA